MEAEGIENQEHLFFAVLDQLKEAVYVFDEDGRFTFVNAAALRMLGYSKEALLSMPLHEIDPSAHESKRTTRTPESMLLTQHRTSDGVFIDVEISCSEINAFGRAYRLALVRDVTERVRKMERVKAEKNLFEAIFENMDEGMLVYEYMPYGGFMIREANRKICESIGYPKEVILNQPLNQDVTPPLVMQNYRRSVEEHRVVRFENSVMLPGVGMRYYDAVVVPLPPVEGSGPRILNLSHDVTEHREMEKRLEKLVESSPGSISTYVMRPDGTSYFFRGSPKLEDLFGFSPEILEKDASCIGERVHADDTAGLAAAYDTALRTGEPLIHEWRYHHPVKGTIWIEARSTAELLPDGEIAWHGIGIDITERKSLEEELARAELRYRRIAEQSPDGIIWFDLNGRPLYMNPNAEKWGWSSIDKRPEVRDRIARTVESARPDAMDVSNGDSQYLMRLIPEADGGVLAIVRDVTLEREEEERRRLVERRQTEVRVKADFLARMSHDIRTPLNAILGFSELLAGRLSDASHLSYIRSIRSGAEMLYSLINQFLDYSRMEAQDAALDLKPASLRKLLADIEDFFRPLLEDRLYLDIKIQPGMPALVFIDEGRVRQVLLNLIGNALKFAESGFISVSIAFRELDASHIDLMIAVEDSGPGIPDDMLDAIFGPFVQVKRPSSDRYPGTGLGLAIVRHMVGLMGGTVRAKHASGGGALLEVELNAVKRASGSVPAEDDVTDEARFLPCSLLIVEDNPENALWLKEAFSGMMFHLIIATDIEECVDRALRHRPDLILMDIRLPDGSGIDALRRLRASGYANPCIAHTASILSEEERNEFDAVLNKPVRLKEMLRTLGDYLPQYSQPVCERKEVNLAFINRYGLENLLPAPGHFDFAQISRFARQFESDAMRAEARMVAAWARMMLEAAGRFDTDKICSLLEEFASVAVWLRE